jgi:hypothetical protein
MVGMVRIRALAFAAALAASTAGPALASTPASDDASDPAYDNGWQTGDAGGTGWGSAWILGGSTVGSGHLIDTSTQTGDGDTDQDGDIDTAGRAFGLFAEGDGANANAGRFLDGALAVGEGVSLDMDHDPGCEPGFRLSNAMGQIRLSFRYQPQSDSYQVLDSAGFDDLGIPGTDEGVHVGVELTGVDAYQLRVTPAGGTTSTFSGSLAASGEIVQLYLEQHTSDSTRREVYFNSISVPEPSRSAAVLGASAALVALARLRERRQTASSGSSNASSAPSPQPTLNSAVR